MGTKRRSLVSVVVVAGLVLVGLAAADEAHAAPTTLNVTTTADTNPASGPCQSGTTTPPSPLSLRDATCVANSIGGQVTIDVPPGDYQLSYGELDLGVNSGQTVLLAGAGAASTTIDGQGQSRVLNLDENLVGGIAITISGVTITGGADSTFGGAGIIAGSGNAPTADTLTVQSSVITGNNANGSAKTITNNFGGGIQFVGGTLSISNSTISNNSSQSSGGAAVFYQAQGVASPEGFSMTGSTISGNSENNQQSTVPIDGVVDLAEASTAAAMTISGSTFTNNTLTDTSGSVRGAALTLAGGQATITGSTFSGNSVGGNGSGGAAIAVGPVDATLTAHNDRIVGNTATSGAVASGIWNPNGASVNASEDWWGCNAGPGSAGCDTVAGPVTTSPDLNLSGSAVTVAYNSSATVSADLEHNSLGAAQGFAESELDGRSVTLAQVKPAGATCGTGTATLSGGTGTVSCTFVANGTEGAGQVVVTFDNQSITIPVTVTKPASVTSGPSDDTVIVGNTASFSATADGYPVPTVQWQVSTDGGTTYNNVAGATSGTYSFTTTAGESGNKYRAVFTNSTGTATTSAATLTVEQPPGFSSAATTTFTVGASGSFQITTTGLPDVTGITESGALPAGLTFDDTGGRTATISGTPQAGSGGTYSIGLTATNGVSPDATQTLVITVDEAPTTTTEPGDATAGPGQSVSFSAAASGYPVPSVQWQVSTDGGTSYTDIPGATSPTLQFTASTMQNGDRYRAVFTNGTGTATTAAATLTVQQAPAFTSADATTFTVGTAGSFTVATSAFPVAALSVSGALPSGLAFVDNGDGTATLSGTPAAGTGQTYPLTLEADNGVSPAAQQSFTLTVDEAPHLNSAAATTFTAGLPGSFLVTTDLGFPSAAITETGTLPNGVTLHDNGNGTGTLSGTPSAGTGGTYPITITAANTAGSVDQAFTLTVDEAPQLTSAASGTLVAGTAGSIQIVTTGYPDAAITESGTLPSGVTLHDNGDGTATLGGTPDVGTGGSYPIELTAGNGVVPDATQAFTLTVDEAPHISSAAATTFTVGQSGSFTVTTDRGTPTPSFPAVSGLPAGVSFADNGDGTATLSGTPDVGTGGSYPVTITATNGVASDSQAFTLVVDAAPAITSADATTFTAGSAGSFTVTTDATGNPVASLHEIGTLPSGVTFVDNGDGTATLAGTPAVGSGAAYPITITASNGTAPDATQQFTLDVDEAPAISSVNATTFGSGVAGSFTVTTSGFPAAALTETGTLPSGVSFADNGDGTASLSGTTTDSGIYPLTLTADNGVGAPATQSFTLTVATAPQTVTFTSTPPANPVVGQTYQVTATGGGSGNPVTFSIDPTPPSVCSIDPSGLVRFDHPGLCTIDAAQAGSSLYSPGSAMQSATVTKAMTSSAVAVAANSITATVTAVAPGAGTPSGTVTFSVDGNPVGTQALNSGTATLTYTVPAGKTHNVSVTYGGDTDFLGSSASTARQDPSITATVWSAHARSRYGWYRSAVVVSFRCTTHGAPLTAPCPAPVTFWHSGAGQSVTRTIDATDGGVATITVRGINIDTVAPTVAISGVRNGAIYDGTAPAARCVGRDTLSGIASCALTRRYSGVTVTLWATATDRAGNTRTAVVRYEVLPYYVAGARLAHGVYQLQQGRTYTFVALTSGYTRPRLYDAAPSGEQPHPAGNWFHAAGRQGGLYRWVLLVRIDHGLGRYQYWVLGVKVGRTMHLIKFHPTGR